MRTDIRLFKPKAWGLRRRPSTDAMIPTGLLAECLAGGRSSGDAFFDDSPQAAGNSTPLAGRLLSLDGHVLSEELDPALAARGVLFGSADRLLADHAEIFQRHWFSVIDSRCDWFAALHAAFHTASTVLYVPPGVKISEPLHVLSGLGEGGVDTAHVLRHHGDATAVGKHGFKADADGAGPAHAAATGVNAGDVILVRPTRHELVDVPALQRFVKGGFHLVRCATHDGMQFGLLFRHGDIFAHLCGASEAQSTKPPEGGFVLGLHRSLFLFQEFAGC
jgi:hypothetical protein